MSDEQRTKRVTDRPESDDVRGIILHLLDRHRHARDAPRTLLELADEYLWWHPGDEAIRAMREEYDPADSGA